MVKELLGLLPGQTSRELPDIESDPNLISAKKRLAAAERKHRDCIARCDAARRAEARAQEALNDARVVAAVEGEGSSEQPRLQRAIGDAAAVVEQCARERSAAEIAVSTQAQAVLTLETAVKQVRAKAAKGVAEELVARYRAAAEQLARHLVDALGPATEMREIIKDVERQFLADSDGWTTVRAMNRAGLTIEEGHLRYCNGDFVDDVLKRWLRQVDAQGYDVPEFDDEVSR